MKTKPIIHPILFALFPVMSLYFNNVHRLTFDQVGWTIALIIIIFGLIWHLLNRALKNIVKSAFVCSSFTLLFFSYGHLISAVATQLYQTGAIDTQGYLELLGSTAGFIWLIVLASVFFLIAYFSIRTTKDLHRITELLNLVSFALLTSTVGMGIYSQFILGQSTTLVDQEEQLATLWPQDLPVTEESANHPPDQLPDIYYIILDGYGRSDILEQIYDYDNSEFIAFLTEHGFYVAQQSHANYCQTTLSLSSSLNLAYLDGFASQYQKDKGSISSLASLLEHNFVFDFIQRNGYTLKTFASGYYPTDIKNADLYLSPHQTTLNAFQNELVNSTPLTLFRQTQYSLHRDRILFALDHLAPEERETHPVFVFAHIFAPHPPFVLGENGEHLRPDKQFTIFDGSDFTALEGQQIYIQGYRTQIAFVTKQIQITIDNILSNSPTPPIIIIQADHGPGALLDWASAENTFLPERMSILNTYYFPDQQYERLYPHISPVNSFRVILDQFFGTQLELLDDRSYYSPLAYPFQFSEVTDKLENNLSAQNKE